MENLLHKGQVYINNLVNQYNLKNQKQLINNIFKISFEDDFDQFYKKLTNKEFVIFKIPLDYSARFDLTNECCLRFYIEPLWFCPYEERIGKVKERFIKILSIGGFQDKIKQFKEIYDFFSYSSYFNEMAWSYQYGYIFSELDRIVIKITFIPIPLIALQYFGMNYNKAKKNIVWSDVMKIQKDCQDYIRDRVIALFKSQGLESEIQKFNQIYKILLGNDSLEDRGAFITYIGVDFEKGKEPSYKIYFNPNNLRIERN